jgi:hypothetical protein
METGRDDRKRRSGDKEGCKELRRTRSRKEGRRKKERGKAVSHKGRTA